MSSFFSRLARHSGAYAIGNALSSAMTFFLIPLYARTLSQADYGLLETLNTLILLLGMVSTIGFASAVLKSHELDVETTKDKRVLFGTVLLSVLASVAICSLLLFLCRVPIAEWLLEGSSHVSLLYAILAANALLSCVQIGLAFLRAQERSLAYSLLSVTRGIILFTLSTLFLLLFHLGVLGAIAANAVMAAVLCIILIPLLRKSLLLRFSPDLFLRLSFFGIAVLPAQAGMWLIDLSDRFFLKASFGFQDVGAYSLSYKLASALSIVFITPFQLAWPTASFAAARRSETEAKEMYARTLLLFVSIGALLAGGLSLYARPIVRLLGGDAYLAGAVIIPIVSAGYVLYGAHFILTTGIHLVKRSRLYPIFVLLPAAVNVGLNALLVPRYGLLAAAWTTLLSFALVSVITFCVTQHFFPIRYPWKRLGGVVVVFLSVLGLRHLLLLVLPDTGFLVFLWPLPLVAGLGYRLLKLNELPVRSLVSRVRSLLIPPV